MSSAGIVLGELRAGVLSWHFFDQDVKTMNKVQGAVAGLTVLQLQLGPGCELFDLDRESRKEFVAKHAPKATHIAGLRRLLEGLPQLQVLELIQYFPFNFGKHACSIPALMRQCTWRELRRLRLSFSSATERDLLGLLTGHAETLETVILESISLTSGLWRSFFCNISGKLPKLRKIRFFGDFNDRSKGPERAATYTFPTCLDLWNRERTLKGHRLRTRVQRAIISGYVFPKDDDDLLYLLLSWRCKHCNVGLGSDDDAEEVAVYGGWDY